jgi:hypothetical protein
MQRRNLDLSLSVTLMGFVNMFTPFPPFFAFCLSRCPRPLTNPLARSLSGEA